MSMNKRNMNLPEYYDQDEDVEYEQDDMNQVSSPLIQNDYYTRRLTDLTNVLYVKIKNFLSFFLSFKLLHSKVFFKN